MNAPRPVQLLTPGRIGALELRNRILLCPMGMLLSNEDGSISDNEVAFYRERARGGAALLIVGTACVAYPRGTNHERMPAVSDDRYLPGLSALTDAVHAHGARIAAQLNYMGIMAALDVAAGRPMLVPYVPAFDAPDRIGRMMTAEETAAMHAPYSAPGARVQLEVMDEAAIAWVIEQYAQAAERCVRAGFDGLEIHAGHGYLIDEFLSPANTRPDGWGGDLEGRARLLVEVIRAVRARVGPQIPVWMRINAHEVHKEPAETFAEQCRVIDWAVAEGLDAVHVTAYGGATAGLAATDSFAPHTVGPLRSFAAQVRARINVPVITYGRYEVDEADALLAAGDADFVAMGRKLIADPALPAKLARGELDRVKPCIYQYRCIGNIYVREPSRCVVNARAGQEHDVSVPATRSARRVLVVGGGPAGMETARLLDEAGHTVTLWEAGDRLGGMLAIAARADALLERYLQWLRGEIAHGDVELVLGRPASLEAVQAFGADEVVVATGAAWTTGGLAPAAGTDVRSVADLRAWLDVTDAGPDTAGRYREVGARVAVVGGGKPGLSIAQELCRRGRQVVVLEPSGVPAQSLGMPGRFRWVHDTEALGAEIRLEHTVVAVVPGGLEAQGPDGRESVPADTVVVTDAATPQSGLLEALRAAGIAATGVGDCLRVGLLEAANADALAFARSLG